LRGASRENEARELLLQALQVDPQNGPTLHALGLLETRSSDPKAALDYLGRAAQLETAGTRHRFVYAIALHDLGQPQQAITELQKLLRSVPGDPDVLTALANYHAELGQRQQALGYARTLTEMAPGNRNYQQLLQSLSQETP
jgi:predicted Zn-dependent protease